MSENRSPSFELPRKLDRILASLSVYYKKNDRLVLQRLLVNSSCRVHEEWTYDNWNGGTYGHAVYFQIPATIYYEIFDSLDNIARELQEGINKVSNVQNEVISEVFLELQEDPALANWRENSGALIHSSPAAIVASEDQLMRLWMPGYLRLFLSHKAEDKKQATQFKEAMAYFGVSCFVAHEDIKPTKEWQNEIEKALFSMNAMVALMTDDFSNSCWTDQEVGVAIGRQIPIIPIRLGMDPYGFIGKYQALSGSNKNAEALAEEVYELLWTMSVLKTSLSESLVTRFEKSKDYRHANVLMEHLNKIENAPPQLVERLEKASTNNNQVAGAYKVKGRLHVLIRQLRGASEESE